MMTVMCVNRNNPTKLEQFVYDYSTFQRSNDFLGIPMLEDVPKKKTEAECRENLDIFMGYAPGENRMIIQCSRMLPDIFIGSNMCHRQNLCFPWKVV